MVSRSRQRIEILIGGALGAGVMTLLGQALAGAGGSCVLLCRPTNAAIYGALLGVVMAWNLRRSG